MLSGCGAASDRFQPGTWELESWMEVDGRSEAISGQVDTVRITPEMADFGAKPVFFSSFYHGQGGVNVTFADGIISGNFDQQAVAPFPAHQQAVEGWYAPDAFEMRIAMPQIAGVQTYQVVQGRLTEPE